MFLKYTQCLYDCYVSHSCIYIPKYMKEDKGKDKEEVHSLREIILYCNMFQRRDVTKAFRAPALWLIE